MRLHLLLLLAATSAGTIIANDAMPAAQPDLQAEAPNPASNGEMIEGYVRTHPVLPKSLEDYELRTLDVRKEVIFHVGDRTVTATVPIFVYVPVSRPSRKQALEMLSEARTVLVEVAARKTAPTGLELAAVRDLIERSLQALGTPTLDSGSSTSGESAAPAQLTSPQSP